MIELNNSIILAFSVYLLVILGIALYAWHLTKDAHDYFLGGRRLSAFVAAFSAGASDMSGWVMLGLPGYAYLSGMEAGWMSIGLCIGVSANWLLCAKRLRVYSLNLGDAVTIPTYLQRRFEDSAIWLKTVAAFFILLFFLFYIGSGLIGGAKLFESVFGLPYYTALFTGTGIIVFYTLFGGFLAVSWTDVFQAILMTLALVIVPVMVINLYGGVSDFEQSINRINPALLDIWTDNKGQPLSTIAIASLLGWGLAYFGQPHILARFKAIRSHKDVPRAAAIGVSWSLVIYVTAVLVGLSGAAYIPEPLQDSEKVFLIVTGTIFHPLVAGILLAALLAAIMSTVDSQLLACSSTLSEDLYPLLGRKPLSKQQHLTIGRYAVAAIALISTAIALDPNSKVLNVVAYAWGGLGAAFGPAMILSLYWPRMTRQGALAGIIVGGLTVIVWRPLSGGIFDLYELVPGFFFALLSIIAVSLLTERPKDSVLREFIKMKTMINQ